MKVLSLKTLNLDGCSGEVIHWSLDSTDYIFQFGCGLVASSTFWRRLSVPLRTRATLLHVSHHSDDEHTSFGLWCFLGIARDKDFISVIECGGGCKSRMVTLASPNYVILRSDIINTKVFDDITLSFSAAKSIFCSCSGLLAPARCNHVRILMPSTRKLNF